MKSAFRAVAGTLISAAVILTLIALSGCGQSTKPKVMVFLGKSSNSYEEMKPVVDKLQEKYEDKVTWVNVDYDDPENKGEIEKYKVTMNPTVIVFNKDGKIKETFMGAAREDMLTRAIESYIPSETGTQSSEPGVTTMPITPEGNTSVPQIPGIESP